MFKLTDIVDVDRAQSGTWIRYKETDFEILISYYGKPQMKELGEKCTRKEYDTRQMKMVETLDQERFRREYASLVIKDWRGLTIAVLRKLLVLKSNAAIPADAAFECTPENKELLIVQSLEFDAWLQQMCTDVESFNKEQEAVTEKNS